MLNKTTIFHFLIKIMHSDISKDINMPIPVFLYNKCSEFVFQFDIKPLL